MQMKRLTTEQRSVLQAVVVVANRLGREDASKAWAWVGQVAKEAQQDRGQVLPVLRELEVLKLVAGKARNGVRLYQPTAAGRGQGGAA
jgi:predicted transcriptional regulator